MTILTAQRKLADAGFNPGNIDGFWGDSTEHALEEALAAAKRAPPVLTPTPVGHPGLTDPGAFFDRLRQTSPFGPNLTQQEVDGCTRILKACEGLPLASAAYILPSEFHETAGTMTPIREFGRGAGKPYGKPGRNKGQIPYGRSDIQLTWDDNYDWADEVCFEAGLIKAGEIKANYDLVLDPKISAFIMVKGMTSGHFNSQKKGLLAYLPAAGPADHAQFKAARRTVNVQDKADLIADYAMNVQSALIAGGWN